MNYKDIYLKYKNKYLLKNNKYIQPYLPKFIIKLISEYLANHPTLLNALDHYSDLQLLHLENSDLTVDQLLYHNTILSKAKNDFNYMLSLISMVNKNKNKNSNIIHKYNITSNKLLQYNTNKY